MTFGQLARAVDSSRQVEPRHPYLGGFRTRDLDQITADMIAWQESGYSTDGMALPPVFAVVRLIASTIDQLPLVADFQPDTWLQQPRRYGSALDIGDLVQWCVSSMALNGSADIQVQRKGDSWRMDVLYPGAAHPNKSTHGVFKVTWTVDGKPMAEVPAEMNDWVRQLRTIEREWKNRDMPGIIKQRAAELRQQIESPYLLHIPYLVTPQHPTGCSPITVARESLYGYAQVERQAATLLGNGTYSGGRLETDQDITPTTAERYQSRWIDNRAEGKLPVLGAGLRYVNDLINPTDAQWLESRQFNSQQVAMMFGVPPDYLGMAMSGGKSSLSYANSQDNDRRFRRNCLEGFTSQIEDALSRLAPQGRGAAEARSIRFDYDGWEASGANASDAANTGQG